MNANSRFAHRERAPTNIFPYSRNSFRNDSNQVQSGG